MTRDEITDRIIYSYFLEKLFSTLTGRIDKIITYLTLIFGSSIVVNFYPTFFAVLIIVLTLSQVVYQFSASSNFSLSQQYKYQELITTEYKYTDEELTEKLLALEHSDKRIWKILEKPAILLTQKKINLTVEQQTRLTKSEKLFSFLAGGGLK